MTTDDMIGACIVGVVLIASSFAFYGIHQNSVEREVALAKCPAVLVLSAKAEWVCVVPYAR